jgi:hypothetical protein
MSDKRKKLETILERLTKLLPHLGNENQNEADNARQKITRLLQSVGLDWHDIGTLLGEQKDSVFELLRSLLEKDADALVRIGLTGTRLFVSADGAAYADVAIRENRSTMSLSSSEFSDWLVHQFFRERRKAPTGGALKNALRTLSAQARYEGDRRPVYLRVAEADNRVYVDLGDPEWRAVEIDVTGWRVIQEPPVRFRRTKSMAALPLPEKGGSLLDELRRFVRLGDAGLTLFVSVLLDALRPGYPHPLLYLAGVEGAAKTSLVKIARALVDPSTASVRALPATVRDIFVEVFSSHMVVFDNVSVITPAISDALCQIATGTGLGLRKLYTDVDQIVVSGTRPIFLTGLQNVIQRSDLADRAVVIPLSFVTEEQRRSEREFWTSFERVRPLILGALFDCIAYGLRELPRIRPNRLPRMADFAVWAMACEGAFTQPGSFVAALSASASEAVEAVVENDAVAIAVRALMADREVWRGSATELLQELTLRDRAEQRPSSWKGFPRDPADLGKRLRKASAVLRKADGIELAFERTRDRRRDKHIEIRRTERPTEAQASSAQPSTDQTAGVTEATAPGKVIALRDRK